MKELKDGNILHGTISTNAKGFGFVRIEEAEDDIYISPDNINRAMQGDEVKVEILSAEENAGRIVEITKRRAKDHFTCTLQAHNEIAFCIPDDRKMYADFFIPKGKRGEAQDKDKVLIRFIEWREQDKNPTGEVVEVLGKTGEHNTEMKAIVLERGFENDFPPEVLEEARSIEENKPHISESEITKRKDMRGTTTFTIDPKTAQDFDDALSIQKLNSGDFEIGVHIADVSHFVPFGSVIDKEAYGRGFSVYLVDRTIPMLPEVLSNDLCSLKPNEDRLAFSAILTVDEMGVVKDKTFAKTIIHSNKRFTYEEAQAVLDNKEGDFYEELSELNHIAKNLTATKKRNGAIEFEQDEVEFELDENGVPIKVVAKERYDVHRLIEEFMLLANKEVARYMSRHHKKRELENGFVYRIHDMPDPEKIDMLSSLLKALGYKLRLSDDGEVSQEDLNSLFEAIEGKPEEGLVKTAAIRSMSKALYSTTNIGHFGLAFEYYTHFTSPIRRYPDLVVHRLLEYEVNGEKIPKSELEFYNEMIPHITDREQAAVEAERASIKYKQVEFFQTLVGKTFEGTITGVTEWGIFIEENETKAEGMIHIKKLGDDYFTYDKKGYRLVGQNTNTTFRLGDTVTFRVASADLEKRQLEFDLAQE